MRSFDNARSFGFYWVCTEQSDCSWSCSTKFGFNRAERIWSTQKAFGRETEKFARFWPLKIAFWSHVLAFWFRFYVTFCKSAMKSSTVIIDPIRRPTYERQTLLHSKRLSSFCLNANCRIYRSRFVPSWESFSGGKNWCIEFDSKYCYFRSDCLCSSHLMQADDNQVSWF